jgi:hypothetical protein
LLVLFAHSPVLRAGLLASDYAAALGSRKTWVLGWDSLSTALFGLPAPGTSALAPRLESLCAWGGVAWAVRLLLRRLLEPRLGPTLARSAATSSAFLALVLPAAPLAIAGFGARAELLAQLLALWGVTSFVAGRQEQREGFTAAGVLLVVLAASVSSSVLWLAPLAAGAEFACVRRHRRRGRRLRTALTTLALFSLAVLLPKLFRDHPWGDAAWTADGRSFVERALDAVLELVWVHPGEVSLPVQVLGLCVPLVAAYPAISAAQHAPRLWGRIFAILVSLLVLLLGGRALGGFVLPLLLAWAAVLGILVNAKGGSARRWRLGAVALGLAILAFFQGRALLTTSRAEARLATKLAPFWGQDSSPLLVLDPPSETLHSPFARDLVWMLHPLARGVSERVDFAPERLRLLSSEAFLVWASSAPFAELREARAMIVRWMDGVCSSRRLQPSEAPIEGPRTWRSLTYVPPTPLDPLDWEFARFQAELSSPPRQLEQLGWENTERASKVVSGVVLELGARRVAEFDLSASLDWRLSGSIRNVRVEKGVREVGSRGDLFTAAPGLEGLDAPRPVGQDWFFAAGGVPRAAGTTFTLRLLSLADLELATLPLEHEGQDLRARGAQEFVFQKTRPGAPVVWLLDYRDGARLLGRQRGTVP